MKNQIGGYFFSIILICIGYAFYLLNFSGEGFIYGLIMIPLLGWLFPFQKKARKIHWWEPGELLEIFSELFGICCLVQAMTMLSPRSVDTLWESSALWFLLWSYLVLSNSKEYVQDKGKREREGFDSSGDKRIT